MEKKLRLNLNEKFYRREAIEESLNNFSEVCEGKIIEDGFVVELTVREDIENLENEFINYVLGIMKHKFLI